MLSLSCVTQKKSFWKKDRMGIFSSRIFRGPAQRTKQKREHSLSNGDSVHCYSMREQFVAYSHYPCFAS